MTEIILAASSWRTRPSRPLASARSRGSACGPRGGRRSASTSTAYNQANLSTGGKNFARNQSKNSAASNARPCQGAPLSPNVAAMRAKRAAVAHVNPRCRFASQTRQGRRDSQAGRRACQRRARCSHPAGEPKAERPQFGPSADLLQVRSADRRAGWEALRPDHHGNLRRQDHLLAARSICPTADGFYAAFPAGFVAQDPADRS
jgi:hypothetical protein